MRPRTAGKGTRQVHRGHSSGGSQLAPVDVAAGFGYAVIALEAGGVAVLGNNDRFQLGLGDRLPRALPVILPTLRQTRIKQVACGQQHTAVVRPNLLCTCVWPLSLPV